MDSLDPIGFTQRYLGELDSMSPHQNKTQSPAEPQDSAMWYEPDGRSVPARPPTLREFERDIRNLRVRNAPERVINSYCGLCLLIGVVSAIQTASTMLPGPVYAGIASTIGKNLAPPELVKECGRKACSELLGKSPLLNDEQYKGRLEQVGGKLLSRSLLDKDAYRLIVLDSGEINAHSVPGYLFVTRGMMDKFPSDGQLALFIGHEIAHAEDRDIVEHMGMDMFEQLAISSTLLKSKVQVEGTGKTVGDYRKSMKEGFYDATLEFEKNMELAADERGTELMLKSGFSGDDARLAIESICAIEEEITLKAARDSVYKKKGFFDEAEIAKTVAEQKKFASHPGLSERAEAVQKAIDKSSTD